MAQRESTRPVAPSEKTFATARDVLSARQWNSSSVLFSAAGETPASKVADLPGLNDNYLLYEGSDGNKNGDDDVVALSQQEANKALRKKPFSDER